MRNELSSCAVTVLRHVLRVAVAVVVRNLLPRKEVPEITNNSPERFLGRN